MFQKRNPLSYIITIVFFALWVYVGYYVFFTDKEWELLPFVFVIGTLVMLFYGFVWLLETFFPDSKITKICLKIRTFIEEWRWRPRGIC